MASIQMGTYEIILILIFFLFFFFLGRAHRRSWKLPFLGRLPDLILHIYEIHELCARLLAKTGGTYFFKGPPFFNMDILLTVDPSNVQYVMSENFENFQKGPKFKKIFEILGDGIFNSDGDSWRVQRKVTKSIFLSQKFQKFLAKAIVDKVEGGLIPVLSHLAEENQVVDLQDLLKRLAFDTTCMMVTGYDPSSLSLYFPDIPFSVAMDHAEEAALMRHFLPETLWKLQKCLGFGHERKLSDAWKTLDRVIGEMITKKKEGLSKIVRESDGVDHIEGINHFDLLSSFLNHAEINDDLGCDDKFLRDTILSLMVAGRDSMGSALTWLIWLIVSHPEVEEKIKEEINAISSSEDREKFRVFKLEELKKMVYLHGALCESLRLYPPVPFLHKSPIKPDILPSGHKVHPKMDIVFSVYAMGRMAWIWGKDCMEFKPERWIGEDGRIKHEPSYKFLTFNAGPRICLGKEVAFNQLKAIAASILHNYKVEVVMGHHVTCNAAVILYMKHGLKVRISKRWN